MANQRRHGRIRLGAFWLRCARRLLPALVVTLLGTLIDATGAPPLENTAVAIQGRRIVQISTVDDLHYSADTPVLDVRGATIMPGFINAHVHITGLSDDDLRR